MPSFFLPHFPKIYTFFYILREYVMTINLKTELAQIFELFVLRRWKLLGSLRDVVDKNIEIAARRYFGSSWRIEPAATLRGLA